MARHVRSALMLLLLMTLITGVLYPLLVTGIAQLVFPSKANGSVIERNGNAVGSRLIGQQFTAARYFWSRPSPTTPFPYNSAASTGSNYGPLNPALMKEVKDRVDSLRAADPSAAGPVPIDLVTSSGSGLDPHITVDAALYQAGRVALARKMPEESIRALIDHYTEQRDLGILGEPGVNVLALNLALDDLTSPKGGH